MFEHNSHTQPNLSGWVPVPTLLDNQGQTVISINIIVTTVIILNRFVICTLFIFLHQSCQKDDVQLHQVNMSPHSIIFSFFLFQDFQRTLCVVFRKVFPVTGRHYWLRRAQGCHHSSKCLNKCEAIGFYPQKVTKLKIANFSHPFMLSINWKDSPNMILLIFISVHWTINAI